MVRNQPQPGRAGWTPARPYCLWCLHRLQPQYVSSGKGWSSSWRARSRSMPRCISAAKPLLGLALLRWGGEPLRRPLRVHAATPGSGRVGLSGLLIPPVVLGLPSSWFWFLCCKPSCVPASLACGPVCVEPFDVIRVGRRGLSFCSSKSASIKTCPKHAYQKGLVVSNYVDKV